MLAIKDLNNIPNDLWAHDSNGAIQIYTGDFIVESQAGLINIGYYLISYWRLMVKSQAGLMNTGDL